MCEVNSIITGGNILLRDQIEKRQVADCRTEGKRGLYRYVKRV